MSDEMSKTEKERQLDEKIKAMRAKNAMAMERKKEVDKDKQLAEINRSSITSVAKTKYDHEPYSPPERSKVKQRPRTEEFPPEVRKEPPKRPGGRLGEADGPPPDPGYRFLADRMREEEDEERRDREPGSRGGRGTRGVRAGRGKERLSGTHEDRFKERRLVEEDPEEEITIVLEKDRYGRIQNHLSPHSTNSRLEERRTVIRSSEKKHNNSQPTRENKPTKIKSLFDDDDEYDDYARKERWKEEDIKGLSSPRKIEDQGGKLTITRTIENYKPPGRDPEPPRDKAPSTPKRETHQDPVRGFQTSNTYTSDSDCVSSSSWECSDPACRSMNLPRTSHCAKCRLAYSKSTEYKNNLACDKYKQEFNSRKPKPTQYTNGLSHQVPQPLFHQDPGMREWNPEQEWKPEPLEMVQYGGDWTNPGINVNQWQLQQEMLLSQTYGMLVNPVPVASFPPPPFYGPRQVAPSPQYYTQAEYLGNPYPSSPQYTFQPAVSNFNPTAQAFIPTAEPAPLFQTPPPLINRLPTQPSRPMVAQPDPNLVLSLKSPPKPLAFNRNEPRKPFPDRTFRSSEESSVSSRLSEKNTQSSKLPPRFNKNKDFSFKPPSMIEMQSGSLKKGSIPPPPTNKGSGLLVFGTSNVVNHLDTDTMATKLRLPVRLVPAMKLETFEEKVKEVNPSRDWLVLIHGLGNDARNIALRRKSDQEKANEADEVANTFCDLIENQILAVSSHICVLVSMLLPRCDFQERFGMSNPNNVRKVINVQITSRLYENSRVTLINSDPILGWDHEEKRKDLMLSDGYHLTPLGFKLMIDNWTAVLMKHLNISAPETAPNPLLGSDPEETQPGSPVEEVDERETVPDPFGTYTAPTDVIAPKPKLEGENVELGSSSDEWDDEAIPALETVELKKTEQTMDDPNPPKPSNLTGFRLGNGHHQGENGEGYIEDDYCGEDLDRSNPLPSLNLVSSGPESDFGPVSGIFLEDSYLPQTLDNLSISRDEKPSRNGDLSDGSDDGGILHSSDILHSKDLLQTKAQSLIEQIPQKTELA